MKPISEELYIDEVEALPREELNSRFLILQSQLRTERENVKRAKEESRSFRNIVEMVANTYQLIKKTEEASE